MDYKIDLGAWNGIFAVPSIVVDKYIKLAGALSIKILLILLRNSGQSVNCSTLSTLLNATESDISDALTFWFETGIIKYENDCLIPSNNVVLSSDTLAESAKSTQTTTQKKVSENVTILTSFPQKPDSYEVEQRSKQEPQISFLLKQTEHLLSKLITPSEASTLVFLFDYVSLPIDVILMVIEYCTSINKNSMRYIEKTALTWADEGIITHELAEAYIKKQMQKLSLQHKVSTILGISDRKLSTKEKEYINSWTMFMSFPPEIIEQAYERTVDRTGKLSFSYLNTILTSWHTNGFKTLEQIEKDVKVKKQPPKNQSEQSYDMNEINMIISRTPVYKEDN